MTTPRVCIAGAGTAGLEGLLRARVELGPDAHLTLIAPDRDFRYRPMTDASLFHPARERSLPIADLVAHTGATWVCDRADVIREAERSVLTRDGDTVDFDLLLLAVGSRSARTLRQGHVWQRGTDPGFLDDAIADLLADRIRSVAVTIPRGARWPLPAYELALILAWTAGDTDARVTLITAEERPLHALGPEATQAVTRELDEAEVQLITGVEVLEARRDGPRSPQPAELILLPEKPADEAGALIGEPTDPARLHIGTGSPVEFDRLISLPTVVGPHIQGIARDAAGFIEVDNTLKVCGSERIWAAGGCLASALEHSALGARQADVAIAAIAAAAAAAQGDDPSASRATTHLDGPDLTGMLLTGQRERWLAENPAGTRQPSTRCLWWPPGRAVGGMLAGQIAAWNPSVHGALPGHPDGLVINVPIALGCSNDASAVPPAEVTAEARAARVHDIENRQIMGIRRRERDAEAELRDLAARLKTLTAGEQQVVHDLKQHGYLLDRGATPPRHHA